MPLDPATLCARTAAGDAEMAAPRHGLAIAQRRLLSFLDQPLGIDELVRRPGVTPERLERDLTRLVEAGLVEIHRPAVPTAPSARPAAARASPGAGTSPMRPPGWQAQATAATSATSAGSGVAGPGAPVVIGRKVRLGRALVVGFLALAAAIAAIGYFAASDAPGPTSKPTGPTASPAAPGSAVVVAASPATAGPPAEPARTVAPVEPAPPAPATAVPAPVPVVASSVQRPVSGQQEPRPAVASLPEPAQASSPFARYPTPAPAAIEPAQVPAPPNPAPPLAPAPAPVAAPALAPPASSAPAPAPVQVAAATPSFLPTRAQPHALEPISRESPEFPREALAAGVDTGVVRARLSIDASGRVTGVEIVESRPRRIFDRAVSRTLSRWTYAPGEAGRTTDVEIAFTRG